jgi:hypothetical protein
MEKERTVRDMVEAKAAAEVKLTKIIEGLREKWPEVAWGCSCGMNDQNVVTVQSELLYWDYESDDQVGG